MEVGSKIVKKKRKKMGKMVKELMMVNEWMGRDMIKCSMEDGIEKMERIDGMVLEMKKKRIKIVEKEGMIKMVKKEKKKEEER